MLQPQRAACAGRAFWHKLVAPLTRRPRKPTMKRCTPTTSVFASVTAVLTLALGACQGSHEEKATPASSAKGASASSGGATATAKGGPAVGALPGTSGAAAVAAAARSLDPKNFDKTCKPCDDFYQFVNGGWVASNPIPPEYPSWNVFSEVRERNNEVLKQILEEASANTGAPKGSTTQKIGD